MMATSRGVVICGGHFNNRLDPNLDSSGKATQTKPPVQKGEFFNGGIGNHKCVKKYASAD